MGTSQCPGFEKWLSFVVAAFGRPLFWGMTSFGAETSQTTPRYCWNKPVWPVRMPTCCLTTPVWPSSRQKRLDAGLNLGCAPWMRDSPGYSLSWRASLETRSATTPQAPKRRLKLCSQWREWCPPSRNSDTPWSKTQMW